MTYEITTKCSQFGIHIERFNCSLFHLPHLYVSDIVNLNTKFPILTSHLTNFVKTELLINNYIGSDAILYVIQHEFVQSCYIPSHFHPFTGCFISNKIDRRSFLFFASYARITRRSIAFKYMLWSKLEFVQTKLEFQFCPDKIRIWTDINS